ncbi:MAG: Crp/Fnr family transcriptional regulator [Mastigocoleus sp. MO_167.B18]|uniref:Crp/Fnr family transcriptional regulator n=1 Tax=Mastigocoleus sp. MO_188.B34 TaxID=3036635 RepID=UPI002622EF36|nr:Crp/Fnr family transcriptional regulator [Mastigocoleus sp. MO_188.B34]MDJ0696393.1 Crp/Fnr family transcriptional regulator [Mastigocoleus sp. MO_188.B34]MDJ0773808.1 Crp/Fnr family transcriptional regulator [Mastigocoleus sp. MO_167.B18]
MMQEHQDWQQFLSRSQLFQGLSPQELQLVNKIIINKNFSKGESIFWQGEPCDGFYLIKKGKVKIFQMSKLGKEQILHIFETGGNFAEVSAFDGKCFPASAIAMTKTELLFFPRSDFLKLLEKYPTLAINMLATFARHLRKFARLVEDLSLKEVPGRLAAYLLDSRECHGNIDSVKLDIPKSQLAALLGTIPETLSRVFYKLSSEGLITIDGSEIQLLDLKGLTVLATGKRL